MRIVLSGVETNNKGAELMLYAILQEIERKFPQAEVFIRQTAILQGRSYVDTSLHLHLISLSFLKKLCIKLKIYGILRRLHLPVGVFEGYPRIEDADYLIDGSGFAFSDQWKTTQYTLSYWYNFLKYYHAQNTKIIFLPQAFGPVKMDNTRKLISYLNDFADLIMPREKVSMEYLKQCHVNPQKIKLFSDFTSLVKGQVPEKYIHLKGGVCIIPNLRMIDKGIISLGDYLTILQEVIYVSQKLGKQVYLLNHEGVGDEKLAYMCRGKLKNQVEVVTGLNGLEVKGLISTAYLCVTSRFHGVASALNSCVPCLATSWSHKYEELFKDYGQRDCVLDITSIDKTLLKIDEFLQSDVNRQIREHLNAQLPHIQEKSRKMWNLIWHI